MGILEKISEIEKEISRTQKNKGNLNVTKHPINYANKNNASVSVSKLLTNILYLHFSY